MTDGEQAQPTPGPSPLALIRDRLPTGQRLSQESYEARLQFSLLALAILVVVHIGVGMAAGDGVGHIGLDLVPIVGPAVLAWRAPHRLVSTLASSWALMASSSLLVHQTGGLIEAHFLFFVLLPLVALYQDWRAFLGAIGYVALSHGVVGTLAPESMYNHQPAIDNPVLWALIHATFVAALVIVLIVDWNFAEHEQRLRERAVDDLNEAQARLFQAQKLESIGQLAAGVAHEINTPVQYVSDNTTFLRESFDELLAAFDHVTAMARQHDADELDAYLDQADITFLRDEIPSALDQSKDGLERVAEIVRAMKDFSHPGSELADTDLNRAISSTATVSRNEWKYVADLELELDDDLPNVRCNEGQMKQVVLNMIVNAAHAIAAGHDSDNDASPEVMGSITITTARNGGTVRIEVSDTGSGMPAEVKERVFDQFFTTKDVGQGTGQGLSMAHDIVTAHGGAITVDSTVGVGTTFAIELPLDANEASLQLATAAPPAS